MIKVLALHAKLYFNISMNTNACVEFGRFLKGIRRANDITAREASLAAGMLPSNFSKLEHGALRPPAESKRQKWLARAVGIEPESVQGHKFFDFAAKANSAVPVDIADIISREDALPLLLRTIGNRRLNKAEIERLVELVRGTAGVAQKPQ